MTRDCLQACRTEIDKANRLLELLERRDDAMFPRFCEALYEARQQGVVEDILRPNLAAGPVDGSALCLSVCLCPGAIGRAELQSKCHHQQTNT